MGRLDGKVAIVTGAGQGVGLGIALALGTEGARVVVAELDAVTADTAAQEVRGRGTDSLGIQCDVRVREKVDACVAQAVERFGTLDILVNNAMAGPGRDETQDFMDTSEQVMRLQWESGPLGTYFFMQACFPHLRGHSSSIINIGSRAGVEGMKGYTAYAAGKEAIRALSKVASREWGHDGIRVNVICPHAVTPSQQRHAAANPGLEARLIRHIALGRLGDAEMDIGRAAVFLASDDASYITGQTIMVSGEP